LRPHHQSTWLESFTPQARYDLRHLFGSTNGCVSPYLFSAAPIGSTSFYTDRPRPGRPAPPATAHAVTLPNVPACFPPPKHPHPVSPGSDPLRRSSWCTRTRRLRLTLYPRRPRTVTDSSQRGRPARHCRPGKGRTDRSILSIFPHRRWILCSLDSTAGGSHPSASKRSTEVGSSCPPSMHNRLRTASKNRDLPSFRRRDFNAPGRSTLEPA